MRILPIVDYEKLTEENIFRHVLGMEYVNRYKCEALNTYIQKYSGSKDNDVGGKN